MVRTNGTLPGGGDRALSGEVSFVPVGEGSPPDAPSGSAEASSPDAVTARGGVGVLSQEPAFFSCLTVEPHLQQEPVPPQ